MGNWKTIRLELASTEEFPAGSVGRAYLMRLPLDDSDLVDLSALEQYPDRAIVRRYWSNEPDETGLARRVDGGCAMCSNGTPDRMLLSDDRPMRLGQRLSIVESNGTTLPFAIASIR